MFFSTHAVLADTATVATARIGARAQAYPYARAFESKAPVFASDKDQNDDGYHDRHLRLRRRQSNKRTAMTPEERRAAARASLARHRAKRLAEDSEGYRKDDRGKASAQQGEEEGGRPQGLRGEAETLYERVPAAEQVEDAGEI